jgi:hypothetical protein
MHICIQPKSLILGMPPPWNLTIHYPVPSNIDEMSILGTLQKKGARKEGRKEGKIHLQGRKKIRIKKLQALKAYLVQGESSIYVLLL